MKVIAPFRQAGWALMVLGVASLPSVAPDAARPGAAWAQGASGAADAPEGSAKKRPQPPVWGNPRTASAHSLEGAPVQKTTKLMLSPSQRAAASEHTKASAAVFRFIASRAGKGKASDLSALIVATAERHKLPPLLVAKIVHRESSYRASVSNGGCYGLMQVAAFHFRRGEDPCDPATNLDTGCRILAGYHRRFGDWPTTLTAYNFGPTATASRGLTTSQYARLVLAGR